MPNTKKTITMRTHQTESTDPEPKISDLAGTLKYVTFVDTWKIPNFRNYLNRGSNVTINSTTFVHNFERQAIRCKSQVYNLESHDGLLVIESRVDCASGTTIQLKCFLRNARGQEIRMSSIKRSEDVHFKHAIQRLFVSNAANALLTDNVLTVLVKIEASTCDYERVKNLRLADDFASLFSNGKFSDVTLMVDNREIRAHKAILACRSSVFATMFEEDRSDVVEIKNFSFDVMKELLRFFYTGSALKVSGELLRASDEFDCTGLKIVCEDNLLKRLRVENAASMLFCAERYHAETLETRAIEFIVEHLKEVVKTTRFECLSKSTMLMIFQAWSSR